MKYKKIGVDISTYFVAIADIATDKTSSYDWNGIKIIDTPGLFTDRQDHDAITYDAIDKADLLVFSLTYSGLRFNL